MSRPTGWIIGWTSLFTAFLGGCTTERAPIDERFPLTHADATAALKEMRAMPVPLARPVIILSGWRDPGLACNALRGELEKLTPDRPILALGFAAQMSFDDCRSRVIDAVERQFPCDDPAWTTQVDVVAVSMGGLVARYAAANPTQERPGGKRLRIARLFTYATPHQGSQWAEAGLGGSLEQDMRPGSAFLAHLDRERAGSGFELYCYGRTRDWVVGIDRTAPPGETAWRVEAPALEGGHLTVFSDDRILADIARRLRGERPFSVDAGPARRPS